MFDIDQPARVIEPFTYRQTRFDEEALTWLRHLVDEHPEEGIGELSEAVCQHFGWQRPNGSAPVASCTVFLRRLEQRGLLQLPRPPRVIRRNGRSRHRWSDEIMFLEALGPVAGDVSCQPTGPFSIRPIFSEELAGFRLHLQRYHYLGYTRSVGEHLYYAAFLGDELVALLTWEAAVLSNNPRDRYIGWDAQTRLRRLSWVVNNRRFLLLPWIRQPRLASRVLSANLRRLSRDWLEAYKHPVWLAETFVDTSRFRGTCYRASNWRHVGETRGFARTRSGFQAHDRRKAVYVYSLHRRACELLRSDGRESTSGAS